MSEDIPLTYKKHLSEPWFTLIKIGMKKSEARVNKDIWKEIKCGDEILFTNNDMGFQRNFNVKGQRHSDITQISIPTSKMKVFSSVFLESIT